MSVINLHHELEAVGASPRHDCLRNAGNGVCDRENTMKSMKIWYSNNTSAPHTHTHTIRAILWVDSKITYTHNSIPTFPIRHESLASPRLKRWAFPYARLPVRQESIEKCQNKSRTISILTAFEHGPGWSFSCQQSLAKRGKKGKNTKKTDLEVVECVFLPLILFIISLCGRK